MYKYLKIKGLRGFGIEQILHLAVPYDNKEGSGLTIIVGANNSGKSTIWEAFRALNGKEKVSFTEGKRNKHTNHKVEISISDTEDNISTLKTIETGGSETVKKGEVKCFTLPSRRAFNPAFRKSDNINKETYMSLYMQLSSQRTRDNDYFSIRLFESNADQEKKESFNTKLSKVLGFKPEWTIEQSDSSDYYLKLSFGDSYHNSDGAGEGFLSVFTIVDSLYDSQLGDIIVIDEPELSLHPALQRKLSDFLIEYSKNRQIVIFTHSPFFINWTALANGAELSRTYKDTISGNTLIYRLSKESKTNIKNQLADSFNLHTLGLEAKEAFFLEDDIILTEGQDDVFYYSKYFKTKHTEMKGSFFGWGTGGADKMKFIAQILKDLGFKKVFGILDSDREEICKSLQNQFKDYKFVTISAKDVRDKKEVKAKAAVSGLFSEPGIIKHENKENIENIACQINNYFKPTTTNV